MTSPTRLIRSRGPWGALLLTTLLALALAPSALGVADTQIDSGPTGTINDDTPTFTFSSPDDPASTFECSVDDNTPAAFTACSGTGTHTTSTLSDGPHTFYVRAIDPDDSLPDPEPAERSFTVDTTEPETTIDSGPSGLTADDTPTFGFSSEAGATFECRIDADAFAACSGPGDFHTPGPLSDGAHTFEVRATDAVGNTDTSPDSRSFTVDTTPPDTTIDSGPTGTIADNTPTFGFSSEAGAAFECRIDSDAFAACSGPGDSHTPAPLTDGAHTFEVRAADSVGNADPTPASRTFTVDANPPDTAIDTGPTGTINDDTPTFGFSSEAGAAFECRIDSDPFGPCSGPGDSHTPAALDDGNHTFEVRATDAVDNADPTPAARSFTVDTVAPSTTLTRKPKKTTKTNGKTAKIKVSFQSEPDVSYECRLDDRAYEPCESPYSVRARSKAGKGERHAVSVRATDEGGNVGGPAVTEFRVVKIRLLAAKVATRTVTTALRRHDFATRVVNALDAACKRRSRNEFACRFSARFPGYKLEGKGRVKLTSGLSYDFRVKAQGRSLRLTDENE